MQVPGLIAADALANLLLNDKGNYFSGAGSQILGCTTLPFAICLYTLLVFLLCVDICGY